MKEILKYSIWAGIVAVILIPFIVFNNMFFPYITGKAFTFRIIVEIIFGLWLILILKDKEFRPKFSLLLGSIGVFTFILLIANINAVSQFKAFWSNYERMEGWITFIHLFAYFLVLSSMISKEKIWLWFLRMIIVSPYLYIVYEYFRFSYDKSKNYIDVGVEFLKYANLAENRFSGPLGNPIYISVYFLFLFFFVLILLYKDVLVKSLKDKKFISEIFYNPLFYLYSLNSILFLYIVYRTSRGALLGLLGGVFVTALLISIFEKRNKILRLGAFFVFIIALISAFSYSMFVFRDTALYQKLHLSNIAVRVLKKDFVKNNSTINRLLSVSLTNTEGQARQLVWPIAIKGFKEKPVLGWGQEGFNYVFNKYYNPAMYGHETWFDRAHNAPLDFLIAGGILGFLSYLFLFISAFYLLWFRKNIIDITEKAILSGLLGGYLFQTFFVFDNLISYILFFITLAYIHSRMVEGRSNSTDISSDNTKENKNFSFNHILENSEYQDYILIPGIIFIILFNFYIINIPAIRTNMDLIKSLGLIQLGKYSNSLDYFKLALSHNSFGSAEVREQLLINLPTVLNSEETDINIKKEFLELTIYEIEYQISLTPNDARYYILMGSLLNRIGRPKEAMPYIQKAIELSPQKQTMRFELIQSLFTSGESAKAMEEAKNTYELDIRYEQAKKVYIATIKNEINNNPKFKTEGEKILNDLNTDTN